MTYYEELGVPSTASVEEIRHSYKTLVRLVHPDRCSDPNLRPLAELQMRRLNQIQAVLCDREERRRYDAGLKPPAVSPTRYAGGYSEPVIPRRRGFLRRRHWLIGLCLPAIGGLAVWALAEMFYEPGASLPGLSYASSFDTASRPAAAAVQNPADADARGPDRESLLARLQASESEVAFLRAERQRLLAQLATPIVQAEPDLHSALAPARINPAAPDRPAPRPSTFAGNWYLVPSSRPAASSGIYAPEYIELRISESAGLLRGRYQARYRATDRPFEPEVAFQFEGPPSLPAAQFPWNGPAGAAGKLTLRLISADQIEVRWAATRFSPALDVASGAAQLVRQQESRN